MRHFLQKTTVFLCLIPCLYGTTFALSDDTKLTFGDVLSLYFTELFPTNRKEVSDTIVKYSGISGRYTLYDALKRGIYYGMIPNTSTELHPDTPMTDRAFARLLQKDFGLVIQADISPLTFADYEKFMKNVRTSFAYKVIHALNQKDDTSTAPVDTAPAPALGVVRLPTADNFYVLENVYSILQDNHLHADSLVQKDLVYAAAEGMVSELGDQYTKFFRPDASADFHNTLDGTIVGIGVVIEVDPQGYLSITDVVSHSPAEKAGIMPKDRIIQINTQSVSTKNGISDDILLLRGKEGTSVDLVIQSGKNIKNLTITRQKIQVKLVDTSILTNAFQVKFSEVGFGTDPLMKTALQKFLDSGKKRLILDLRNNPGGSLFETKNILNYFIDAGNPTMILSYPRVDITSYAIDAAMTDWSRYEIVILMNHDTASAAEVIATTLREYFPKSVAIIGETSYGKGTVQELVPFEDNSLLKYTVAKWLTPKNKISIDKVGIKPDKVVTFDEKLWKSKKLDTQLSAAEKYVFPR